MSYTRADADAREAAFRAHPNPRAPRPWPKWWPALLCRSGVVTERMTLLCRLDHGHGGACELTASPGGPVAVYLGREAA